MLSNFMETIQEWLEGEIPEEDVESVETNAGSIWITLTDGSVKSIMVIDCDGKED